MLSLCCARVEITTTKTNTSKKNVNWEKEVAWRRQRFPRTRRRISDKQFRARSSKQLQHSTPSNLRNHPRSKSGPGEHCVLIPTNGAKRPPCGRTRRLHNRERAVDRSPRTGFLRQKKNMKNSDFSPRSISSADWTSLRIVTFSVKYSGKQGKHKVTAL